LGLLGVTIDGGAEAGLAKARISFDAPKLRSHGKSLLLAVMAGKEGAVVASLPGHHRRLRGHLGLRGRRRRHRASLDHRRQLRLWPPLLRRRPPPAARAPVSSQVE
jgi:hypothetical protein